MGRERAPSLAAGAKLAVTTAIGTSLPHLQVMLLDFGCSVTGYLVDERTPFFGWRSESRCIWSSLLRFFSCPFHANCHQEIDEHKGGVPKMNLHGGVRGGVGSGIRGGVTMAKQFEIATGSSG